MRMQNRKYRLFISAADPSADAHCAGLITALKQSGCDFEFIGVGGSKMAAAGCELLEVTVGRSVMMYKAFAQVAHFYKLVKRIEAFLKSNRVDLVVVCDSPSFNWHVAKAAKRLHIKTMFYVAPQLWAWAGWRISKLRKYCDKLCCILPFEEAWFSRRGVDTTFVGNPLLDVLPADMSRYRKDYRVFDCKNLKLAMMPGSRTAEIESLWPAMQQIALQLKQKYPGAAFTAVAADNQKRDLLMKTHIPGFECDYSVDSVRDSAARADFALVASGSATLEVASAGCPMVVMYQTSRVLWHLVGRWLVRPKHFCLVNLLADRRLVPEFMPYFSSIMPIVETVDRLLRDTTELKRISDGLINLAEPLTKKKARDETAKIIVDMLHQGL